jgi:hypothetical protein
VAQAPPPAPAPRVIEIDVLGGELATGFNHAVYDRGERVRLRVRSDDASVVEIQGYGISQPISAGGELQIEFDAVYTGLYKVRLKKGNLLLALLSVT